MKGKRRIAFVVFLIVGNVVIVGLSTFYYLGKDMFEYIAVFTSISTAAYAVLNEQEKEKPEPLLRVRPIARGGLGAGTLGLDVDIDNIGDAPAKDVKVLCKTNPQTIGLEDNGVYKIRLLLPKEPPSKFNIINSIESEQLSSQNLDVEVTYSNMENRKQTPIKENYAISELIRNSLKAF